MILGIRYHENNTFTNISKMVVEEMNNKNLHFIYGDEILTDFSRLSTDLLHPSDYGYIVMSENVSKILRRILKMEDSYAK
ncbi:MAG: hypothetical protein GX962_06835 [Epulopiscium sp.]|nr:hypothetical protein [Candidatus Epulonipiscium sp.]